MQLLGEQHFPCIPNDSEYVDRADGKRSRSWPPQRPKHGHDSDEQVSSTYSHISEDFGEKAQKWQEYRRNRYFAVLHNHEFRELVKTGIKNAERMAARHASYETINLNAFSDTGREEQGNSELEKHGQNIEEIPDCLPEPYRCVDSAKELGQYMAASSYVVALTGAPVPDMRYGIIIVPCGDEKLFFSQQHSIMSVEDIEDVYAKSESAMYAECGPELVSPSQVGSSMDSGVFQFYDTKVRREEWVRYNEAALSGEDAWNVAAPISVWPTDEEQDAGHHDIGYDHSGDSGQSSPTIEGTTVTEPTSTLSLEEISASQFRKELQAREGDCQGIVGVPTRFTAPPILLSEYKGDARKDTLSFIKKEKASLDTESTPENCPGSGAQLVGIDGAASIQFTPSTSPTPQPLGDERHFGSEMIIESVAKPKSKKGRSLKRLCRTLLRRKDGHSDQCKRSDPEHNCDELYALTK